MLVASLAWSATAAVARPGPAVRLVAPTGGAALRAGDDVVLEWTGEFFPSGAREWEAFLSVNGGSSYAYRLTPHLDLELRRVSVRLPDAPTGAARLLLRFGDERREAAVELTARFTIVPGDGRLDVARVEHFGRGEAARPGDPGVVGWAEGAPSGERVREVEAGEAGHDLREVAAPGAPVAAGVADAPCVTGLGTPIERVATSAPCRNDSPGARRVAPPTPLTVRDRTQRSNE